MFGWLGKLFGSSTASEKVVDSISNGLDKLIYTDEEKAEDISRDRSEGRRMFLQWIESTQGSNLARRFIALCVTCIWALQYVVSTFMLTLIPWYPEKGEQLLKSATSLQQSGEQITGAMMLVLAFYFSATHMGKFVDAAMSKFSKTPK